MQFSSLAACLTALLAATATANPVASPASPATNAADAILKTFAVSLPKVDASQAIHPKEGDVPKPADGSVSKRDELDLEKRQVGCVYVTSDANFQGNNLHLCVQNNACTIWADFWRYGISSFGPDFGTTCVIYTSTNCGSGGSVPFTDPGYGNLGQWNDNMGSFRCWW